MRVLGFRVGGWWGYRVKVLTVVPPGVDGVAFNDEMAQKVAFRRVVRLAIEFFRLRRD